MKIYASEIRVGMLIEYKDDLMASSKDSTCKTWKRWCVSHR